VNVTLIASGSRGDVQPYVALGAGLKEAGHAVRVLSNQNYQDLVTDYGLDFAGTGSSEQLMAAQSQMSGVIEGGNLLDMLSSMGRGAQQLSRQMAASGIAACQGADCIVVGLGGLFTGLALSEKLGVPLVQAHYLPLTPTGEFPSVLAPLPPAPAARWVNRASHRLTQQMLWQTMFRAADNLARAEVLRMAQAPFWGPFAELDRHTRMTLYGYSPHVVPPPADWPGTVQVTGYWFLDPPAGWEPPGPLVDFLRAGPPPVYVGFGSMPSRNPEQAADLVLRALARTGQRAVLSSGWGGLKKDDLPGSVCMIGSVPHSWLFPQMAAVVHHGGAGTTAAGLSAGVPSIITPFFGDQPFWGRRVHALGVGPKPIPRRSLTVDRLAEAIQAAVSDPGMRQRAARLGERIRAEDGVARAVAMIGRLQPA
jgi:UDP:flavonoid glycosyltransferase YjiC (YdhE family)